VKRILDLEFVEISEITIDDDLPQGLGHLPALAQLPVMDISQWHERYCLMAAILATRFPHKPSELFAYQASIVWAEQNYKSKRWVSYDRQFRREALAWKDLNWFVPDQHLYNKAFIGRACSIPCCKCLQDDHLAAYCPRNPNCPSFGWFSDPSSWSAHTAAPQLAPVHNAQ